MVVQEKEYKKLNVGILLYYYAWLILRDRPQPSGLHLASRLNRLAVLLLVIFMCMFGTDTFARTYSASGYI